MLKDRRAFQSGERRRVLLHITHGAIMPVLAPRGANRSPMTNEALVAGHIFRNRPADMVVTPGHRVGRRRETTQKAQHEDPSKYGISNPEYRISKLHFAFGISFHSISDIRFDIHEEFILPPGPSRRPHSPKRRRVRDTLVSTCSGRPPGGRCAWRSRRRRRVSRR